jgi:hypothetical protein
VLVVLPSPPAPPVFSEPPWPPAPPAPPAFSEPPAPPVFPVPPLPPVLEVDVVFPPDDVVASSLQAVAHTAIWSPTSNHHLR